MAKRVANLLVDGLVYNRRSAKISFTLLAHASRKVAGSGLAMLRFSRTCQAKSLFRALVRLLFWHQFALTSLESLCSKLRILEPSSILY